MRDCIYRQDAIAALTDAGLVNYGATGDGNGMIQAVNVIKGLPATSAWIPVTEAMPDDDDLMLVTCQSKNGTRSVNRAYYDGQFWHGSGSMAGVTAWMPLPEPYGGEQDGKL